MTVKAEQRLVPENRVTHGSAPNRLEHRAAPLHLGPFFKLWREIQAAPEGWDMEVEDRVSHVVYLDGQSVNLHRKLLLAALTRGVPGSWVRVAQAEHLVTLSNTNDSTLACCDERRALEHLVNLEQVVIAWRNDHL